jgi:hypothetical protein
MMMVMMMKKRAAYEEGFGGLNCSSDDTFASRLRAVHIECKMSYDATDGLFNLAEP